MSIAEKYRALSVLGLASVLTLASAQALATPGNLIRAAELKTQPFVDAPAVAQLADGSPITVVDSKGGWSQVKSADGKTGWVRLLNVRLTAAPTTQVSTLQQIGGVVRTGTTKAAATTGVKGLSKEDIANARPNHREVQKLDAFVPKAAEVNKFAASRKLTAVDVPELKP
jgi:uncharacterized protein YgiM (DUF1202 family)